MHEHEELITELQNALDRGTEAEFYDWLMFHEFNEKTAIDLAYQIKIIFWDINALRRYHLKEIALGKPCSFYDDCSSVR